uniref:Uncharacterized protein n=1 Tax=Lates calcarifer TaxID=8187 RepID=A0A4W6C328_LATCA
MAAAICLLTEDQFLCPICLDVFTDPVTTPCGHNFCKNCINQHWENDVQHKCPMCKKIFYTRPELQVNIFISEMANLEARICKKHNKPLELFCKNDQMCVCILCAVLDHKPHTVVPLKDECEGKKMRQKKIQDIKHSVELSDEDAHREKAAGLQVYNILRQLLERGLSEITESVEEKQRKTQEQAKGFITELEQELFALMKRSDELKQLSHSEDDLDFLQTFPLLTTLLPTKDWTNVSIPLPIYEGSVRKAMETGFEQLEKTEALRKEKPNRYLVLSNDEKQVRCVDLRNHLPDNTERFSYWGNVLGRHGYSSGRFYYEVQVTGKTEWYLGVARKSVDRKASSPMSPQNGYWKVHLKDNEYKASDDPPVSLSLKSKPKKVGVFVDYEEGLVSFYDTDAIDLIYSFTGCSFTERLYPFLNPCIYDGGKNSAPLIITSVTSTK